MRDAGYSATATWSFASPRQYAENGEIVVVLVHNEEATVKAVFPAPATTSNCDPKTPIIQVMHYGFDDVLVQGKVVGHPERAGRHPVDAIRKRSPRFQYRRWAEAPGVDIAP